MSGSPDPEPFSSWPDPEFVVIGGPDPGFVMSSRPDPEVVIGGHDPGFVVSSWPDVQLLVSGSRIPLVSGRESLITVDSAIWRRLGDGDWRLVR